jgi:N5-(cytidine 5'-diphosphoramidyl)-L-glutamine hydrolase
MKLLITMRTANAAEYDEPRQAISNDWISLCQRFDFTPILMPSGLEHYHHYFDLNPSGLILTGGDNVSEALTSQRDRSEFHLIEEALKHKLPILGVCRGIQILNAYFGGSIVRELKANHIGFHDVIFKKSQWGYNIGDKIKVNSFHHHGIYEPQLANEFEIIAQTDEGCIEYMEHSHLPITGIHWHPERQNEAAARLDQQIIVNRFKA